MLPEWFVIAAVIARLAGGAIYAVAVLKRRAAPNPVTWFFWALTPLIVFFAQLYHIQTVGWSILTTLALGVSPLVVFLLSLRHNLQRSHFTPSTIVCGMLAALGVLLWLTTSDPVLAIVFSIAADAAASVPTVIKSWRQPASEYLPAYGVSMLSVTISLLTMQHWSFAATAFPIYIFIINFLILSAGLISHHRLQAQLDSPSSFTDDRR